MALSIMAARRRASLLSFCLLACFLQVLTGGQVFQALQDQNVFLRSKRANRFLVEEILQGNLERECYEERCSYEEAREYFEDTAKTISFWTVYYDGDQCLPNPCLHGGNCTDKLGGFQCSCPPPHYGAVCELGDGGPPTAPQVTEELSECPTGGPMACHQLCTASYRTFSCSCMEGFSLQPDGRSCLPEVEFPCGRLPDELNTTAPMCRHGNCPWQVSLLDSRGAELCSGVVLGRRSVLTAARCLLQDSPSQLRASKFAVAAGGSDQKTLVVPVRALYFHDRFHPDHHDNNLAFLELARPLPFSPALIHLCLPNKDFCENILMRSGKTGMASGRGGGPTPELVYMTLDECRHQGNASHPVSNKMFCMKRQNVAQGSPNGPLGSQNGDQGRPDRPLGNQNGDQGRPNGLLDSQNGDQGRPNSPLGSQNGDQGRPDRPLGSQNGNQGRPDRPLGNQNGDRGRPDRPLGNQNGDQGRPDRPLGSQNGDQGRPNGLLDSQNGDQGRPNSPLGSQNGDQGRPNSPLGSQNGDQGRPDRPLGNQNGDQGRPDRPLGNQNGDQGRPNSPLGSQNGDQGRPNSPLGSHNGDQGRPNRFLGNQNGDQGRLDRPLGNPNGDQGRPDRHLGNQGRPNSPLGNQNGDQGRPNSPLGSHNGDQGRPDRPLWNQNGDQGRPNSPSGSHNGDQGRPNRPLGSPNGDQGRLYGHTVNQSPAHSGTPNGAESRSQNHRSSQSDHRLGSKVSTQPCSALLSGTPVATAQRGTAFLTGLLMSSTSGCDGGLVFVKLSRYLSWIRPRLEATEGHMTPQVSQDPEQR